MVIACVCAKPKPDVFAYSAPLVAAPLTTSGAVVSSELLFSVNDSSIYSAFYKIKLIMLSLLFVNRWILWKCSLCSFSICISIFSTLCCCFICTILSLCSIHSTSFIVKTFEKILNFSQSENPQNTISWPDF